VIVIPSAATRRTVVFSSNISIAELELGIDVTIDSREEVMCYLPL
jgi:hypothetical protein